MDWQTVVEWGLAVSIAYGAKREMGAFRVVFKQTLDRLTETVESHSRRIENLERESLERETAIPPTMIQ